MPLSPAIKFVAERIGRIEITIYNQEGQALNTNRFAEIDQAMRWLKAKGKQHGYGQDQTSGD